MDFLEDLKAGAMGRFKLTDAIDALAGKRPESGGSTRETFSTSAFPRGFERPKIISIKPAVSA
jgi:hypothetical protein